MLEELEEYLLKLEERITDLEEEVRGQRAEVEDVGPAKGRPCQARLIPPPASWGPDIYRYDETTNNMVPNNGEPALAFAGLVRGAPLATSYCDSCSAFSKDCPCAVARSFCCKNWHCANGRPATG